VRAGEKRSNPAETGVCVVKTLPARVAASAASKGHRLSSMKLRARSSTAKAACPSLRWQTPGSSPSVRSNRQPPIPKRSSCCSRRIRGVVAVEQIENHTTDLNLPGAEPDLVARQLDRKAKQIAALASHRS